MQVLALTCNYKETCKYKETSCKYKAELAAEPVLAKPLSKMNIMQIQGDVVQIQGRVGPRVQVLALTCKYKAELARACKYSR